MKKTLLWLAATAFLLSPTTPSVLADTNPVCPPHMICTPQ